MLRSGEGVRSAAKHEAFGQFLGFLIGVSDEHPHQVAEVLRAGLIAVLCGNIGVEVPQITGRA